MAKQPAPTGTGKLHIITNSDENRVTCTIKSELWTAKGFKSRYIKYYTKEFELLHCKWHLQCSDNDNEGIHVRLQCISLPDNAASLGINYHFNLTSSATEHFHSAANITSAQLDTSPAAINYAHLEDQLTITLDMDATTTFEDQWIKWNVCGNLMRHFRTSKVVKWSSPFIIINGIYWKLICKPKIKPYSSQKYFADVALVCEGASAYGEVVCCIKCEEAAVTQTKTKSIRSNSTVFATKLFAYHVFEQHDQVIIQAKICPTLMRNIGKQSVSWSLATNELKLKAIAKISPPFMINGMTFIISCNRECMELIARQYGSGADIIKTVRVCAAFECKELNVSERRTVEYVNNSGRWSSKLSCNYEQKYLDTSALVSIKCTIWLLSIEYMDDIIDMRVEKREDCVVQFQNVEALQTEMKQNEDKYQDLYDKHQNVLQEWNENSSALRDISSLMDTLCATTERKSDENEDEKCNLGLQLFDAYSRYDPIMKEQTERLSKVITETYLLELIKHQNKLSKAVKDFEDTAARNCDDEKKEYEVLTQKRINLQNKIKTEFEECNAMIQRENELVEQIQSIVKSRNEVEALKTSSKTCVSVIKSYNDFMENNKLFIDGVNGKFEQLWNEFEAKWLQWNVDEVVSWFKYKTMTMKKETQKQIHWNKAEKQLKRRNISGKTLLKFNDFTFELIGIQDVEIVDHLVSAIKILMEKYKPVIVKETNIKQKEDVRIPKEYLCPITKQIMQDPVIAFDGHNYDRNPIESYLKIHKKSPITGADADYLIVFPNHKLKTDILGYVAAHAIDLEQHQDSSEGEGEGETIYVQ